MFNRISWAAILAGVLVSSACQSSSTNVLGPSGGKCAITVPNSLPAIDADGGTGTLAIEVAPECVWSASTADDWIAITSNTSGQGSGSINYTAAANPRASMRRGAVLVSDRRVELMQSPAPCRITLTPETASVATEGGEEIVSVTALDGCRWSSVSDVEWLSVVGAESGVGAGTVRVRVGDNSGPARVGGLTIADRKFTVYQDAASLGPGEPGSPGSGSGSGSGTGCSFNISPTNQSVTSLGGALTVAVTAGAGCRWTASSQASWITVGNGTSGTGNGTVALTVAINTGGQRTGTVAVAGQTHTVTQAALLATCAYSIDSSAKSIGASGGTTDIAVTSGAGCNWTAASQTSWITVVTGSGSGSGNARLSVASNSGSQRTGTATVAGQTVTVTQAGAPTTPTTCTYSLDPTTQSVGALGGNFSVQITTQSGCGWTAASQNGWIELTSSSTGTGSGRLNYRVALGLISSRSGSIKISGQTLTVNQAALLLSDDR